MNFYDFIKKNANSNKIGVACDVDLAKHDKRYHAKGVDAHTHCKYRTGKNLGEEPNVDPTFYDKLRSGVDIGAARKYLWELNGVECYHTKNGAELVSEFAFHHKNAEMYDTMGTPVTASVFEEDVCAFFAVVKDINDRLSIIPFGSLLFLPFHINGTYGVSSLDLRVGTTYESFMSIGDLKNAKLSPRIYHHDDARLPYDIIRHEIGHSLAKEEVLQAWREFRATKGDHFDEYIAKTVSDYAATSDDEGIAETFSRITSPDYEGTLPEELESLVMRMLGSSNTKGEMTMDERSTKKRLLPKDINPLYFTSFDFIDMDGEGIQWYDRAKGRYETFETYADKLRYGLECYQLPKTLIEGLAALPNKRWDAGDIHNIAMAYYTLGESEAEIIKEYA